MNGKAKPSCILTLVNKVISTKTPGRVSLGYWYEQMRCFHLFYQVRRNKS